MSILKVRGRVARSSVGLFLSFARAAARQKQLLADKNEDEA
jgi:hypothetical protein